MAKNPFPSPGSTAVIGYVKNVTNTGAPLLVSAWVIANGYATPDANIYFDHDPLVFEVLNDVPQRETFNVGDGVTFDVVQGNYAPAANNVQRK